MKSSAFASFDDDEFNALSAARQRRLRELLDQLATGFARNPLAAYVPHVRQVEFHSSHDTVKAFIGGNRSGKTTAGIVDDLIQAIDRDAVPPHLLPYKKWEPPFYCRVVAPDLTQTLEQVIYHKIREWCPREQLKGGGWDTAFNKQTRVLSFANGSRFGFFTYEMDVDKFGGAALHRIHYDEEPQGTQGRAIRQECQMRLIDFNGDELFTMTPQWGLSWVYDEIWENRHREGITAIQVDMDENPHLSQKAKERLLKDLTDEERQARKEGKFVHLGGLFYPEFSDHLHVRNPPSPDQVKDWDVVVGIDPGHKTGVTWIGFDGDNCAFVFDEFYPDDQLPDAIASEIKRRNQRWGIGPSYVIDPAARMRTGPNAEQFTTEYARHGIYCAEGQNARGPGITEVKRRLQRNLLFVSKDCRNLIWEMGRYRRDSNAPDEWAAIKKDDHLCFVPGTRILTETGERPIESVVPGERVWTREGLRRVETSGLTTADAKVYSVVTDGPTLTGTANHPVWVEGKGWTPIYSVRYGDKLRVWQNDATSARTNERKSSGTGFASTATRTLPTPAPATTSRLLRFDFIGRFGRLLTAPSLMAGTFTTSTATRPTTTFPISSSSAQATISATTLSKTLLAERWRANTCGGFSHSQRRGTRRPKASRSTSATARKSLGASRTGTSLAISAANRFRRALSNLGSALRSVGRRNVARTGWITSSEPAKRAATRTPSTATPSPAPARVSVRGVYPAGRSAVYNLTVSGTPEFFANGILSHNCDAMRYGLMAKTWVIPKVATRRSNYNSNPRVEPPWRGPTPTESPPLGSFS